MITPLQTMMKFDYLVGIGMIIMMLLNDDSNEFVLSVCVWISKQLLLIHFDIEPKVFNSKIIFELFDVVRSSLDVSGAHVRTRFSEIYGLPC